MAAPLSLSIAPPALTSATSATSLSVPAPTSPTPCTIKIALISDINCPWCYVASKEIKRAMQRLPGTTFELEHRPYMLNPQMPDGASQPKLPYIKARLGEERWETVQSVLRARGAEVGIDFTSDGVVCSTWRAHRLLLLAWKKGGSTPQMRLLDALYAAAFERGEDIGDVDTLAGLAESTGLVPRDEAAAFLKSDELKAEVQSMVSCAQRNGVSGVPFAVIDGRWAISGGQTADVFYQIFEKRSQGKEP